MFRGYNLKQRTVIDTDTAERIGYITDVEINEQTGAISRVIIRRSGGVLAGLLGRRETALPWSAICAVGREFVLVRTMYPQCGGKDKYSTMDI